VVSFAAIGGSTVQEPVSTKTISEENPRGRAGGGPTKRRAAGASALAAGGVALVAKAKGVIAFVHGFWLFQVLLTAGTAIWMIVDEAKEYGWHLAIGLVGIIFVHEMGHLAAMRRYGLDISPIVFVPGWGAYVSLRGQQYSPQEGATIALAGPAAGGAASFVWGLLYVLTMRPLPLALAYGGFFLNMLNLMPVAIFDGHRAAKLFSFRGWWLAIAVMAALLVATGAQILIVMMAAFALVNATRLEPPLEVTEDVRRPVALRYFALCGVLALGAYVTGHALSARFPGVYPRSFPF
jgi:Zn-dependent protease